MSPTSHLGTMVAERKQQVTRGGGRMRWGRGCRGAWRSSSFYLPWILCFGPYGLSTITLVGSSSCRPPILLLFPLILYQPLSHTSYGRGSKTWISHLLRLLCNYLERRRRGEDKMGKWRDGGHILKVPAKEILCILLSLFTNAIKEWRGGSRGELGMRVHKNRVRSSIVVPQGESE